MTTRTTSGTVDTHAIKAEKEGAKRGRDPELKSSSEFATLKKKQKIDFLKTIDDTINYDDCLVTEL